MSRRIASQKAVIISKTMEERIVKQYKIYVLTMNDMRSPHIEDQRIALMGPTSASIMDYLKANEESWQDGRWGKSYRQGSKVEWCNPPFYLDESLTSRWIEADGLEEIRNDYRWVGE
jgi:hypothetical protein